jgi:hypothetical protein
MTDPVVINGFLAKSTNDILKSDNPRQKILDVVTLAIIQKYKLSRENTAVISIIACAVEKRMWHNANRVVGVYANLMDITERMDVALEQAKRDIKATAAVI